MPKPTEIIASLADTSAIDSYESLQAEMVDLFTNLTDCMRNWNDERPAKIMRKMAATIETVPYDMLAELGHSYNAALISCMLVLRVVHANARDYADAHDLVLTLLDGLRSIDLDHPDTQKALDEMKAIFKDPRQRNC